MPVADHPKQNDAREKSNARCGVAGLFVRINEANAALAAFDQINQDVILTAVVIARPIAAKIDIDPFSALRAADCGNRLDRPAPSTPLPRNRRPSFLKELPAKSGVGEVFISILLPGFGS